MQLQVTEWLRAEVNVNNLFDRRYFTRRAGGYPGPGIIPADGRVVAGGLRFMF
jgi:Fe(3+) dicitrate transport protein